MERKVYQVLASRIAARLNSMKVGHQWVERHTDAIEQIERDYLPSGSGFDAGTKIDLEASNGNRLVLVTEFHHMNEMGGYDGWTTHRVIVEPDLYYGFTLTITGRDRDQIKDYLSDMFNQALDEVCKID